MISNIPTDIEKKIDHIFICLPFNKLSVENQMNNIIPTESELLLQGKALKIRMLPDDSVIDHKQSKNKPGTYWNFNSNFDVVDNNKPNFDQINFFTNKKVVLIIGTSTQRFQLGNQKQPLDISFKENTSALTVTCSGQTYLPASRQNIASFQTTS